MILTLEDLDGEEYMDDFETDSNIDEINGFAQALKTSVCNQIDSIVSRTIDDMKANTDATKQLKEVNDLLGYRFGNLSQPLKDRVQSLVKENERLNKKIKDTDEMLLAKRHYLPLIQRILSVSQERDDQAMVNRIHAFLIEGKVI